MAQAFVSACVLALCAWADARVARIYGGTTETIKEVVGRDPAL